MIGEEGPPGLARWASRSTSPVPLNRALAHADAQLQQLAPDSLAAPPRVLPSQPGDQRPHFGAQPGTAQPPAGAPAPEQLPGLTMPAHHCIGLHEDQMLTPVATEGA